MSATAGMRDMADADTPPKPTVVTTARNPAGNWLAFVLTGILSLLLGIVAIAGPLVVAFALNLLLGALLAIGGLSEIVRAVRHRGTKGWWWALVSGALYMLGGWFLVFDPLAGILALTIILSIAFIVKGISAIVYAFGLRPARRWGWLALSGVASVIVGLLIFAGWPASAFWAIGLLAGIELVLFGCALIVVGLAGRAAQTAVTLS